MSFTIKPHGLSCGLFLPLESYPDAFPTMADHEELAQQAERLGFSALWFRDVPLYVPSFGDVGQLYDPWTYMGFLSARTTRIGLATGSAILTLRHPIHVAKAAASADQLSQGRVALGVASGDRPEEFPAFGQDHQQRGQLFRQSFETLRELWQTSFPRTSDSDFGHLDGEVDLVPKPFEDFSIPLYITGHAGGQSLEWIARHGDGWIYFPMGISAVRSKVTQWRRALEQQEQPAKPYLQSLYIDLFEDPDAGPEPLHLGFRSGRRYLLAFLKELETAGVNHVMFVLKFASRPVADILEEIGQEILPHFNRINAS